MHFKASFNNVEINATIDVEIVDGLTKRPQSKH